MKFLGIYDTIPLTNDSDTYKYQQDFGFLRDDGIMVIAPVGTTTDGASIPAFPPIIRFLIGGPLQGDNKLWASPHDALYRKLAIIIDTADIADIDMAFIDWRELSPIHFEHQANFTRKWADETLLQAMMCAGEGFIKRWAVYHAIRACGRGWWTKAE